MFHMNSQYQRVVHKTEIKQTKKKTRNNSEVIKIQVKTEMSVM